MDERKMILVGRSQDETDDDPHWSEWRGKSFSQAKKQMTRRRIDKRPMDAPDEIVEVIVLRRAVISSRVEVQD